MRAGRERGGVRDSRTTLIYGANGEASTRIGLPKLTANRRRKHDLPTEESPMRRSLNR